MARRLILEPSGWQETLEDCPPGLFVSARGSVGLKTEYGPLEVYCDSGEAFWGGTKSFDERLALMVQPVVARWLDDDDEVHTRTSTPTETPGAATPGVDSKG